MGGYLVVDDVKGTSEKLLMFIQGESSSPIVTDNNPKTYEDPVAPLYITVGTGGATLHKFNGKESYVQHSIWDLVS